MPPIAIDASSLAVASNCAALCLTAVAVLLWRSKQMYPGFGRWTIARLIGLLTLVFALEMPRWREAIVLADACVLLRAILSFEACRQFLRLQAIRRWTYSATGILLLQLVLFRVFSLSPQFDYVEVTFVLGAIHAWTGFTLLHDLPEGANRGRIVTGAAFVGRSLIYMLRTVYFLIFPNASLLDNSSQNLGFLISDLAFDIVVNFSFFLMHYERAVSDKAEEVRRTMEANAALTELKGTLEERVRQRTAELVRSQKLESVARLAGGVAHDFNNILMVINGYSALLLGQMEPHDPMYEPIAQIGKAGERAAAITRQLLSFSKEQKDEPQVLSLNSVVTGMMDMLRRLIREDVEIVIEPGPGNCHIRADKGQIEQVVMNLAINARDAMPGGGKLTIAVTLTTLRETLTASGFALPPGTYAVLAVTDTGIGMAPEVLARIFEPFYTTKGHEGTGLGLSTTYGIVKQNGGGIAVRSKPGFGTTFNVYFPAVDSAPAIHPQVAEFVDARP
jgi:signal transduction histidine kinase